MAFTEADLTTLRAAAAAALKTYNNARATGAHNDIGGGVIMLRSVVGSTLGGFAGAGGGDYNLQAGSPAKAMVSNAVLGFDYAGTARPTTGDSAGAYYKA